MRKILTVNNQVEFHEISSDGVILNIKAFQYGVLHYQIKNGKVVFYSNADENPWRNEVWSVDMPVTIDDEVYSTADEVAEALSAVMNDSYQEQLDALQDGLATEEGRAQAAEEALQTAIENETSRATSAETNLQSEITSVSATVATFDGRITNVENGLSALTETVNGEITRSTAKDAEHDAQISGLTTSLQNEVTRAQGAESALTNSLNNEIARATSAETQLHTDLTNEVTRAENAESVLATSIGNEVTRASAKDSEHDTAISGLNTSIQNEITRATSAETALHDEILSERDRALAAESGITANLNAEISRATARENAIDDKVDAEVSRSTAKDASQDALISGLTTSLQNEINRATSVENALRSDLNAEISARTNADAAQLQRITALEVGKADANSVYTKAESDAKYTTKDYISGLTEAFFDAAAYDSQTKKINFYHGNTIKAQIDATSFIKDGMVDNVAISGSNLVITFNTDAGKEPISIPLTDIFDPNNYYTKTEIDNIENAQNSKINEISGKTDNVITEVQTLSGEVQTISGESYSKSEVDTKLGNKADLSAFTAHTANTTVHVTAQDKTNWNNKSDFSGSYNDLTDKPTIPSLDGYATQAWVSGYTYDKQTIDDKIAEGGTFDPTQYYTKSEVDGIASGKADSSTVSSLNNVVTAHTASTSIHVTSSEKQLWNNKSDFSGNYNDLTNKPTIPNYSAGTNVQIQNDVISATDTKYTAGSGITITGSTNKITLDVNVYKGNEILSVSVNNPSGSNSTDNKINGMTSFGAGYMVSTNNVDEAAFGYYNETKGNGNSFSHSSGNTLFSVGNGNSQKIIGDIKKHNAFEIRQNGDIYIADTNDTTTTNAWDKPMIKLQDALATAGGSGITSAQCQTMIDNSISGKTNQSDFTAHTANTTVHITSAERTSWNAKPNVWCGDETAWSQISGSTESGTIYLVY